MCLTNKRDNSNNDSINDLREFEFNKIKTLNSIKISLSAIKNQSFIDFENLEVLVLNCNKLTKIKANSFQHLSKLKKLNLCGNQKEFRHTTVKQLN